jgi:hypothetical protein
MNNFENITIRNHRDRSAFDGAMFPVDRSTPLGNPFYMAHESERNKVCDEYARSMAETMRLRTGARWEELVRIYEYMLENPEVQVALVCWCAPKRCHAESVRWALQQMQNM